MSATFRKPLTMLVKTNSALAEARTEKAKNGVWREFVLAYRATFNPPGRDVREVLYDFEYLGIVSQLKKNPVWDSHRRCSNLR